jgi:hypothetical protein
MSGDDSVEKEYEAAVEKQNYNDIGNNSPLHDQQDDDDDIVDKSSSGGMESNTAIVKTHVIEKENLSVSKDNSSIDITAGIESYDSQDDESPINQNQHDQTRKMNVIILFPDDWRHNSIGAENPII